MMLTPIASLYAEINKITLRPGSNAIIQAYTVAEVSCKGPSGGGHFGNGGPDELGLSCNKRSVDTVLMNKYGVQIGEPFADHQACLQHLLRATKGVACLPNKNKKYQFFDIKFGTALASSSPLEFANLFSCVEALDSEVSGVLCTENHGYWELSKLNGSRLFEKFSSYSYYDSFSNQNDCRKALTNIRNGFLCGKTKYGYTEAGVLFDLKKDRTIQGASDFYASLDKCYTAVTHSTNRYICVGAGTPGYSSTHTIKLIDRETTNIVETFDEQTEASYQRCFEKIKEL